MANWTHNGPCPKCGSRDNLGHWDDGSLFCWGCHYYKSPQGGVFRKPYERTKVSEALKYPLPDDFGTDFSEEAVQWLAKYGLSVPRAIANGIGFSASKKQLIFRVLGADRELLWWQSRNLDPVIAKRKKYFNGGDPIDIRPIYGESLGQRLVLVEDIVSAIRVGAVFPSMPLLGSYLPRQKLVRLARLYSSLWVWLDSNKFKEAQEISKQAKMLGLESRAIYTDLDPKCYSDDQIKEILK